MATILEPLTVSCSSTLASPAFSTISASSFPSFSALGRRGSVSLPKFRGLKINPSLATRSVGYLHSTTRLARRGARIACEAPDTAVQVPAVGDSTWKSLVLESDVPVLVEFWAPWCGPCRMIHPIIDELAKEYAGKFKFYKVNTDDNSSIATQYGIRSIPTVIIFNSGEKKESIIGAVPKTTLTTSIEKFL